MPEPTYLTQEGAVKLKSELEELKGPKRNDIAKRLRSAIQMGDLSENADYHKAKEDQGFLEGRIQELEMLLATARVIEEGEKNHPNGLVAVGSTVTIQEQGFDAETYTIVGAAEANPRQGKISNESPIGKAILNHQVGESVPVETPDGTYKVKIIKIK